MAWHRRRGKGKREKETHYRSFFENVPVGIFHSTPDGRFLKVNPALVRLLGYQSAAEMLALKLPNDLYVDVAQRQELRAHYEKEGVLNGVEVCWKKKGGEQIVVSLHAYTIRDTHGRVVGYEGTVQDVTARKWAEDALKKSEERYRSLFENANDMIMTFTLDGTITSVNRGLEVTLNWSRDELIGQSYKKLATPSALALAEERTRRALVGEKFSSIFEAEILRKDGRVVPIEGRARFIRDDEERPIGIQGICRDITERKQWEVALRESEAKYRTIFTASPDFIYLTDMTGKVLDANPVFLDWMDLPREELQQRHFLDFIAGENRKEVLLAFARLRQGCAVRGLEVRARNAKGEIRDYEVNAIPLRKQGRITVTLNLARDITTHKQADEMLQILTRRLLEVQEAERRHLARELHDEVGQALTALKINLQAIHSAPDPFISCLKDSVNIIDLILHQVRNLSLDLRPSQLDDLGIVTTLQWYIDRQVQRVGLMVHFVADLLQPRPAPPLETACFRVVQEAITNVVRHAQARQVWVELRQHDDALHLFIRDDGVGFNLREARMRIMQGTSLGILGMEERVRLAGGTFVIVSEPGHGTEIRANLPLNK
jgi:PAS domain S-box-containing protein